MMRFVILLVLCVAAASAIRSPPYSAASEAQIRFAIENKYDDTGPGARQPELAYSTYRTLDEALLGYIEDPDTKLPEAEKQRAIQQLLRPRRPNYDSQDLIRYYPKTVEEYTGFKEPSTQRPFILKKFNPKKFNLVNSEAKVLQDLRFREVPEPYRLQKFQPSNFKLLNVALHSKAELRDAHQQFNPHPRYSYSYGVHIPDTGDSKSAQETREGGNVRGYYSFLDADGMQRTVRYTADDHQGFRASVERAHHS